MRNIEEKMHERRATQKVLCVLSLVVILLAYYFALKLIGRQLYSGAIALAVFICFFSAVLLNIIGIPKRKIPTIGVGIAGTIVVVIGAILLFVAFKIERQAICDQSNILMTSSTSSDQDNHEKASIPILQEQKLCRHEKSFMGITAIVVILTGLYIFVRLVVDIVVKKMEHP